MLDSDIYAIINRTSETMWIWQMVQGSLV
jgi:hypothetical protein